MAILEFKKDLIAYEVVTDGYYDKRGVWHEGSREWVSLGKCGSQPAVGENPQIPIPDGSLTVYEYILHLDRNCPELSYGQRVKLAVNGGPERIYSVVGFQRLQLQTKVYVKATS